MVADQGASAGLYPGWRFTLRYRVSRASVGFLTRLLFRVQVEGPGRFPSGPAVVCFNHLNWIDPFVMLTVLPPRPRIHFFGPKEEDMSVGARNRLMMLSATAVPFRPGKDNLLDTTRRVRVALASGGILAIAGEGRIQPDEHAVLEIQDGAAFFALQNRVPVIPVALNGTSALSFRGRLRVRVGEPIVGSGRPTAEAVGALSTGVRAALLQLVADAPLPPTPSGRWAQFTELFNDWPEGSRALADAAAAERRATASAALGPGRDPADPSAQADLRP
jgi:1-acyl-sn-glycerol-3-phosphate acyltransferase